MSTPAPAPAPLEDAHDPGSPAPSARRLRTCERLLDSALDLFAEVGVEATSIEAICERAGFTRGAFYSNFADKDELIDALAAREQESAITQLREAIDSGTWECTCASDDALTSLGEVATTLLDALTLDRRWGMINGELRLIALRNPEFAVAHQHREDMLLDAVGHEIVQLVESMGRELAIPTRVFVRLLWAGFQVDFETTERSAPGGPTTTELASEWIPIVTARLTQPRSETQPRGEIQPHDEAQAGPSR